MSAQESADNLLAKLLKGKAIHDVFAQNMRKVLQINGQPLDVWETKFKIHIPTDDLSPGICKLYNQKLLELCQDAAFYHAYANIKVQTIKRSGDSTFRDKFFALTEEWKNSGKKLPASATLETLARVEIDDIESAQSIAEIEMRFWKDIMEHLDTCRRLIENASFNNNNEIKLNGNANR